MIIDHVGIAVRSIEEAVEQWRTIFGYQPLTDVVTNRAQKVRVVFLQKAGSLQVKLIEPTDASSPVYALVRRGGGLHHLCFRCESLDAEVARLRAAGIRILAEPQPGEAFEGEEIAFFYAGNGLNVELIDTDRRASRIEGPAEPGGHEVLD
jgi:methylmalonyl-CoA/ethylmalonyl-CoA epimerase